MTERSRPVRTQMDSKFLLFLFCLLPVACSSEPSATTNRFADAASEEAIELTTPDSVTVYGMLIRPVTEEPVPLILAFHQGGASGLAEYNPIIPRLLKEGFAILTIDQRRGGERFGGVNKTAAAFPDQDISYCDVYSDLETALDFALRLPGFSEIIAWGSSYSATLAAQLAADYPGAVAKVLAFSPASGDVMEGCQAQPAAQRIQIPAVFLRPRSEMSIEWVAQDMASFIGMGHEAYIAFPGTHGSSMLVPARAEGETEQTWQYILDFLRLPDPINQ